MQLTTRQVWAAAGAVLFLVVQMLIISDRDSARTARKLEARVAADEADLAAMRQRVTGLEARLQSLAEYVLPRLDSTRRGRSEDSPPPPEL